MTINSYRFAQGVSAPTKNSAHGARRPSGGESRANHGESSSDDVRPDMRPLESQGKNRKRRQQKRAYSVVRLAKQAREKDGLVTCDICSWHPPVMLQKLRERKTNSMLHAHHVVPVSAGGADAERNIVVLCPNHHAIAHSLGSLLAPEGRKRKRRWTGPTTPEQLLAEIRWLESDDERWSSYIDSGRQFPEEMAQHRRETMRVVPGSVVAA